MLTLLVLLITVFTRSGWWVSIWVCSVITEIVILMSYTNLGIGNCSYGGVFNCDEISCGMVWLSVVISGLSLLSSASILAEEASEMKFLVCVLSLMGVLVICFSVDSLLVFYVFFEVSLIPTFLIICGWGYQPERLRASKFMILYTVGASLPLLAFVLYLMTLKGSVSLVFLGSCDVSMKDFFFFLMAIVAFLVKVPMYGLHMWLPKAHVEAPVAGSMLLAGVLLKLGGYGLARFMTFLSVCDTFGFTCVICLCIFGGMVGSVICCFQTDIKSLVAYSSVGHMSLVLCGFMSGSLFGFVGAYLLMVSHGLSSPGMFYLVSEMYKLFGTRSLFIIHGMMGNLMGINLWLAFMCGFNAAAPPSLSICGEVVLYISLVGYSFLFSVFLGVMSFLSCLYSWFLYCSTQTGNYPVWVRSSKSVACFYFHGIVCWCLSFPLVGLCVKM
uniref:NADH-ubiquinone oxidoreductase chain 4 n=1 Tax=Unio pictorum TaxID=55837 RepID=A0A346HGV0_UNIPI|nr:NADH dehydrogenase subunit 4 [Unio pictorum]AXO78636.1 NADH dehydrogenase subunit 4 [Unio pictorum]